MSKTTGKPMGKMVLVEWHDATMSTKAWGGEVDVMPCQSVGFLIKKDRKQVQIANSKSEDGDFGGVFTIPRGFLRSIREVAVSRRSTSPSRKRKKGAKPCR